jgi:DNA processing protein
MRGARTIRREEHGWPPSLAALRAPPHFLRVMGELPSSSERVVAVVGSRAPDESGAGLARRLGAALARAGAWVVSGGAAGIDAAAHRGALEAGGRTAVVLGGGLDHLYPAAHRALFARVVDGGGCLAAEVEDDVRPAPFRFAERNRIVAALASATVVVRAGERSGALITAARARELGRPVLAAMDGGPAECTAGLVGLVGLPGTGAHPFRDPDEALRFLGLARRTTPPPALAGDEAVLWGALRSEHEHADMVARRAGLGPGPARAALLALELRGLVEQKPGRGVARRY